MESSSLNIRGVWDASLSGSPPDLPVGVVHLWQRELHTASPALEQCRELLSAEEREKAMRYRIERPRSDYILTRGTVRFLLAQYLHLTPAEISFRYTQYGKPLLAIESDLRFNVSHSHGLALMGFVRQREIGVDVEQVRAQDDAKKLAERFFSIRERESLRDLTGDDLHAAFFRCWTRKEAYIKAKGEGLSLPLHQFDVSIEPDPTQALLATRPDRSEAKRWTLLNVSAKSGYAAALAVQKTSNPRSH